MMLWGYEDVGAVTDTDGDVVCDGTSGSNEVV